MKIESKRVFLELRLKSVDTDNSSNMTDVMTVKCDVTVLCNAIGSFIGASSADTVLSKADKP